MEQVIQLNPQKHSYLLFTQGGYIKKQATVCQLPVLCVLCSEVVVKDVLRWYSE